MPFEFLRAEDAAGAVATVTEHPDAVYLAGGTNLVDHMKLGVATPSLVSTSATCRWTRSSSCQMARFGSARSFATAISPRTS